MSTRIERRSPRRLREDLTFVYHELVGMTDRVSEALATIHSACSSDVADALNVCRNKLSDVNLAIWRIRWELGVSGGEVAAKPEDENDGDDTESEGAS